MANFRMWLIKVICPRKIKIVTFTCYQDRVYYSHCDCCKKDFLEGMDK